MPDRFNQTAKTSEFPLASSNGLRLLVTTHVTTGKNPLTRPGVGFDVRTDREQLPPMRYEENGVIEYRLPLGVLDREQVRQLRNLLTEFMLFFPENDSGA